MKLLGHDLHTLTGAYALDAVSGAERERFERHLNRCQSCDHEVRGLQETATRLALAVARVPPPGLKVAVLAAAAQTRQHPPVIAVREPEPQPRWRPRLAITVATVAVVVAVALAVTLGIQQSRLGRVQQQQRAVAAVLNAPDARFVTDQTSLGGTVTVVSSRRLHELIFTSRGLPALTGSRVYQLWLMGPTRIVSAGLVPAASQGQTAPVLASGLTSTDKIGVTVEPAGGTKQPTTQPIVVVTAGH